MVRLLVLLLALACLGPAQAQERRDQSAPPPPPPGLAPNQGPQASRQAAPPRGEAREPRRFTRAEREQLRQDVNDANKEIRGRRR